MPNPILPPGPKVAADPGNKLAEIARKSAAMTKDQMALSKKQGDEAKKPGQKPIPSPNARKWLERIERSRKVRKQFLDDAERFLRMYQGDYSERPGKKRTTDKMSVNIVYSHVEIITPSVFSGFPAVRVRPKPKAGESTEQAQIRAKNMELVLTYWAKELAIDEELRDVFFDTFFSLASVELGWETEIEEISETTETEDGVGEESLGSVVTIKDRPFVERRDFRMVFLDPDAKRRKDCRWIALEEVLPFNDFLASSKFTDKAKAAVKAQTYPKNDDDKNWMGRPEDQSEREWVQIYTIWDKDTRKKFVVTKDYPGYLNSEGAEGEDWPYEIEYKSDPFPISIHDAKRDRNSPYSWSEFKAYEPQILELNRIRQSIQIHVKRALPKIIYTSQAGDKAAINKLMNARTDEATMLDNISEGAIGTLKNAEIPKDLYNFNTMAKDDLLNVSGLFEYQNSSGIADTATEASMIEGRSEVRKTMRSKLWEQFVVEIFAKLAQLCQQNMDEAIAVEIAGQQGVDWLHVTKDQIQGEFFFDVEPGIMEYKNESLRKQQLLKFAELTAGDPNVNRRGMLGKVADELDLQPEDVILPIDQIPPAPPPPPTLKFKEIDVLAINDSALQNAVLLEALKENGVDIGALVAKIAGTDKLGAGKPQDLLGEPPPSPEQGGAHPGGKPPLKALQGGSGKDMAGMGANPNGNPNLPPVKGNLNAGGNPAG
jgi:hypothetical protein